MEAKSWTYEGYWNAVLGANRNALDVIREFGLTSELNALDQWLLGAELAAMATLGCEQRTHNGQKFFVTPEEWAEFHDRAISELEKFAKAFE